MIVNQLLLQNKLMNKPHTHNHTCKKKSVFIEEAK